MAGSESGRLIMTCSGRREESLCTAFYGLHTNVYLGNRPEAFRHRNSMGIATRTPQIVGGD